ncbi:hypothetical protein EA187_07075 [Lujinxingia sediminis]|uniref:Acetyl xylan esterase domain-containing protein n=1 Tax=Lujinxingia sediminis TaxID=2480984 RepID=A0ABY0CVP0_9DELT|nr:hypothetical protein [Lujinxingia sediminis]RVU46889.1 hypothetical protein EA187_07075 [Lujinxingia sediminis]
MGRFSKIYSGLGLMLALSGCRGDEPLEPVDVEVGEDAGDVADGGDAGDTGEVVEDPSAMANAMGQGGHVLLPWPAAQYQEAGEDGVEVRVAQALIPAGFDGELLGGSGASRVAPMVTWLEGGIDPRGLPDADDWGATLGEESLVQVVVVEEGQEPRRWPVLAEMDLTAREPGEATLLIRPHRPFPAGAQVVVGLRRGLRTYACVDDEGSEACVEHGSSEALARVVGGEPADEAEEAWVVRGADAMRAALGLMGEDVEGLVQAWSFRVRDRDEVVSALIAMQRIANEADASNYRLEDVVYEEDRALVYGEVEVPWFLDGEDRVVLDEAGTPQVVERRFVEFLVTVPRSVDRRRPVVLFGHGFFSAIEESTWGNLFGGLEQWEMAAVTTRFYGFAEADLADTAGVLAADSLQGLVGVIDLQRQSQANFTVVHNMLRDHLAAELEVDFGEGAYQPLDGDAISYMGISNGGTQGFVMMSTSPAFKRGALIVPGGGWSHMLQRAAQWPTLGGLFTRRYRNRAELQLGVSMLQQIFDPVDSLNYAELLLEERLEGMDARPELLVVEALHDSQVANMVSRWVAGAAGVPQVLPGVEEVWEVPRVEASSLVEGDVRVGYEIYDLGVEAHPPGNVAAEENDVHNDVRLLESYRAQVGEFLESGRVERFCDGVCDPG